MKSHSWWKLSFAKKCVVTDRLLVDSKSTNLSNVKIVKIVFYCSICVCILQFIFIFCSVHLYFARTCVDSRIAKENAVWRRSVRMPILRSLYLYLYFAICICNLYLDFARTGVIHHYISKYTWWLVNIQTVKIHSWWKYTPCGNYTLWQNTSVRNIHKVRLYTWLLIGEYPPWWCIETNRWRHIS